MPKLEKKYFIAIIVMRIVSGAFAIIPFFFLSSLGNIFNALFESSELDPATVIAANQGEIITFVLLFALFIFLSAVVTVLANYYSKKIGYNHENKIRKAVCARLFSVDNDFFNKNVKGEIMTNLSDDITRSTSRLLNFISVFFASLFVFIFFAIFLFIINWFMGLIMIITIIATIIVQLIFLKNKSKQTVITFFKSLDDLWDSLFDGLKGMEFIKSDNQEALFIKQFKKVNEKSCALFKKIINLGLTYTVVLGLVLSVGTLLIIVFSNIFLISFLSKSTTLAFLTNAGVFGVGTYIVAVTAALRSFPLVTIILRISWSIRINTPNKERLDKIYNFPIEQEWRKTVVEKINPIINKNAGIKIQQQLLFEIKNLNLQKGDYITIIGDSGSGKSVFASILKTMRKSYSGSSKFGNVEIKELNQFNSRRKIAYSTQNTFLFNTTIQDNILFYNSEISKEKLHKIMQICELDDFIIDLPNGLLTPIINHGSNFSQGQKQRITLARELALENFDVLILDEPTANLDKYTSLRILDSLKKHYSDKIIIHVEHDYKKINNKSKIYKIEQKKLIAKKYADVIEKYKKTAVL